jgi:hypothetical protein
MQVVIEFDCVEFGNGDLGVEVHTYRIGVDVGKPSILKSALTPAAELKLRIRWSANCHRGESSQGD